MTGNDQPLRIVQITDTHIHAVPGARLWGVDVDEGLENVLATLKRWHWPADFLLGTGDLVQDEGESAYQRLLDYLEPLGVPVYCLPGNHDIPVILEGVLNGGQVCRKRHVVHGAWQFILLDSTLPSSAAGHLSERELFFLDSTLKANPDLFTMICLHHQPVPVGSAWLDAMMVDNAKAFFNILDRHSQVRAVVWGHIHQDFAGRRNDVALLGCPSTCVQFKPGSPSALTDEEMPGYRWFKLTPTGEVQTGLERARYAANADQLRAVTV
jgi:Icc protein